MLLRVPGKCQGFYCVSCVAKSGLAVFWGVFPQSLLIRFGLGLRKLTEKLKTIRARAWDYAK
jgi:hypothetical protein